MTWEHIELDIDDGVATITLNRPEALNAFRGTMRLDLLAAVDEAAGRARAVIITGAGKAFCSGGDVKFMSELRREKNVRALRPLVEQGKKVVRRLRSLDIPTIASINGVAAGAGLSLALACDVRLASSRAKLSASFTRIGLHPDWGGTYFLTRLAGASVARELIFTGRLVEADEARELGLVSRVVEPDELRRVTLETARAMATAAPVAISQAKRSLTLAETSSLDQMLDIEEEAQLACFLTEDAAEGFRAFGEKRRPDFKGE